jgi:multimeric flavodoxin WrbA
MKNNEVNHRKIGKAIILDGSRDDDLEAGIAGETLHSELGRKGIQFTHWTLRDIEIAPCIGCFQCWTKTPGECVFDDEQRRIYADMAKSDLVILITPITFGGYSSELKKGLDRFIPVLLPFFRMYNGETHHPSRSGKEWNLLGVGTLPLKDEEKERLFRDLVKRNSLNMHSENTSSVVLYQGLNAKEIEIQMTAGLKQVIV